MDQKNKKILGREILYTHAYKHACKHACKHAHDAMADLGFRVSGLGFRF
jgi:hypothetical protein